MAETPPVDPLDLDGDGQNNQDELRCGSDPMDAASTSPDEDANGVPDCTEEDTDADGQSNTDELACGSDPEDPSSTSTDTDTDGIPDCLDEDDDGDGQSDEDEQSCGSDPLDRTSASEDTDGDSIPNCVDPFENTTQWPRGAFADWPTAPWSAQVGALTLQPAVVQGTSTLPGPGGVPTITKTSILLGQQNAAEHATLPGYMASGKSNCCGAQERVPFRTYVATCRTDTAEPKMFVSLTMQVDDEDSIYYKPSSPRIGAIFEAKVNPATGALEPTGNRTFMPICNEAHGIAASADCSTVGVLCAPSYEEPFSERYAGAFTDLTTTAPMGDQDDIIQPNNLGYTNYQGSDQYAGEMWLLEWNTSDASASPIQFATEPAAYVIHRSFGGQPLGAGHDLVYAEDQDAYGTAFPTSTFKSTGKRHRSAALMVVDRSHQGNGFVLNADDRGFPWECGYGHVIHARPFFNPH